MTMVDREIDTWIEELFKRAREDGLMKDHGITGAKLSMLKKTDKILEVEKMRGIDCNDDMLGTLMEYYKDDV